MDVLPTLAHAAGVADSVPADRVIDGESLRPLLEDPENATTPRDDFLYFDGGGAPRAVRDGAGLKYFPDEDDLYDLRADVGEQTDVSDERPADIERLSARFDAVLADLEANGRPVGDEPGEAFTEQAE